ncbi:MAG: transporter substrate-binding domain-containing protein [Pseudomonadota bacterium]
MRKVLAIAAAAMLTATTASAETLKVGTECTYHPFNYRTDDGKLTGYDVDVANEVAKRIGAEIEFVCQEWKGMIPALLAGKFDLIVASMSITEKRLKQIDFTGPYRVSIGQFVGKPDLELFKGEAINAAGFEGVKIGLERATTYEEWIKATVPSAEVAYYDNNEAMYLDLAAGRVDAIMTNPMKAYLKFLSQDGNDKFAVLGPQIAEEKYFGIGVGIGLRQGQDALKGRLNTALEAMTKDGTLSEFGLRYFPFTIHPQEWKGAS